MGRYAKSLTDIRGTEKEDTKTLLAVTQGSEDVLKLLAVRMCAAAQRYKISNGKTVMKDGERRTAHGARRAAYRQMVIEMGGIVTHR